MKETMKKKKYGRNETTDKKRANSKVANSESISVHTK